MSDSGISRTERDEILSQINELELKSRKPLAPGRLSYTPQRAGVLLPILVNVAALLIMGAAALSFPFLFGRREASFTTGAGVGLSGEGAIVGALKRESKQQLSVQVQQKEQELRAAMDAQLAAEKVRIGNSGASAQSLADKLRAFQDAQKAALEAQLAEFQKQKEAELAQKDAAIGALQTESASEQRVRQQLTALRDEAERQQLVLDQVTASYAAIIGAIKTSRDEEALASLASLSAWLALPSIASMPAVQKRKDVDQFLIDALKTLAVAKKGPSPQPVAQPAAQPAEQPASAAPAADAAAEAARITDAEARGEAQGEAQAASKAADAARMDQARADGIAQPLFEKAETLARKGSNAEAIAAYTTVIARAPQSSYLARAAAGIQAATDALARAAGESAAARGGDQARAAAVRKKLRAMGDSLSAASRTAGSSATAAQDELISLLQVKVQVRKVLVSDQVRAQNPDLAAKLDRFLDLTSEVRRAEGRAAALADAASVVGALGGAAGSADLSPLWQRYSGEQQRAAMQKLLDALQGLVP
ncbi:MAG: hypothetical protein ACLQDL_14600 [Spirochaetia bacterium]